MIELEEIRGRLSKMRTGLDEMLVYLAIQTRREMLTQLEERALSPGFWNEQQSAKDVIAKTNAQRAFVKPFDELVRVLDDSNLMMELAEA